MTTRFVICDYNLLVFQLRVSRLDHETFEGGVVLCSQLETDQLTRLHPLSRQAEEGGAVPCLGGVVMARGDVCTQMMLLPELITGAEPTLTRGVRSSHRE